MAEPAERKLRVLELYSGIGGMHCALRESGVAYKVVTAIDVNSVANKIYHHNFPSTTLLETGIESFTCKQLDKMKVDMILMSPPCQPFTRVGKKLDVNDPRTKSFLHLLNLLPRLKHCPQYILVENVKGFELSQARQALVTTLKECNFTFQECLLTPLQFGIPNSRLRYYLIAKKLPLKFCFPTNTQILDSLPSFAERWMSHRSSKKRCHNDIGNHSNISSGLLYDGNDKQFVKHLHPLKSDSEIQHDLNTVITDKHSGDSLNCLLPSGSAQLEIQESSSCQNNDRASLQDTHKTPHKSNKDIDLKNTHDTEAEDLLRYGHNMRQVEEDGYRVFAHCQSLGSFLEEQTPGYFEQYNLPDKDLKRFIVMDIVHPCLTKTICFTKRYGHFMEGAGSIVQMTRDVKVMQAASEFKDAAVELKNRDSWGEAELDIIRKLELRYFTPREIANLLCFPKDYSFPSDVSRIQKYRTLGNSLNVHVVSLLIRTMVEGDNSS